MSGDRVLVVGDEPRIRRALNSALVAHGYAIPVAENGATALQTIASWVADDVVLDLVMSGVDGFGMLCQTRIWSPVPIIVLSVRGHDAKLKCRLKQIHDLGVELRSSSFRQLGNRHIYRKRGTIDTIRRHGVKRIGHGDDASAQRNALALETIRVSRTVPPLMMVPDGIDAVFVGLETADDVGADGRVLLDLLTFLVAQLPWLFQGAIPRANLAQVVDMSRGDDGFGSGRRNLGHRAKNCADMLCNPDRVTVGVGIAPFQGVGQSLHGDPSLVVRLLDTPE
ncbi:MAG: DNA-binding response regulator, partial [Thermomicrobiales bacterium]|nr:DNA-binding response regulator [Thermomicrobiales bacterium]